MPLRRNATARVLLALSVIAPFGCMTGGAAPPEDSELYGDRVQGVPICENPEGDSPTDQACHDDCTRVCGFNAGEHYPRALKYCECEGGVFIECRCPRADWYKGAMEAPYCDDWTLDGSGRTNTIDPRACVREWQQCIARDVVDGYTPRGCVCVDRDSPPGAPTDPNNLEWVCGSTEKWFYPDQSTIP